jgi:lipopolysaccharide biosynthesis glycosyltransferase
VPRPGENDPWRVRIARRVLAGEPGWELLSSRERAEIQERQRVAARQRQALRRRSRAALRRARRHERRARGRAQRSEQALAALGASDAATSRRNARQAVARVRQDKARASFVVHLQAGADLAEAAQQSAVHMVRAKDEPRLLQQFGLALRDIGADDATVGFVLAMGASRWDLPRWRLVHDEFVARNPPLPAWRQAGPILVRAALALGEDHTLDAVLADVEQMPPADRVAIAEMLLAVDDVGRFDRALASLDAEVLSGHLARRALAVRRWRPQRRDLGASVGRALAVVTPEGPDPSTRATAGQHLATRALLALARTAGTGEPIRCPRHAPASVPLPDDAWVLVSGETASSSFGLQRPFDLPDSVNPVVIGWKHRPGVLTPAVVRWLRRAQPVGCLDRASVEVLLGCGVDAFLSGPAGALLSLDATWTQDSAHPPTARRTEPLSVATPLDDRLDRVHDVIVRLVGSECARTNDVDLAAALVALGASVCAEGECAVPGDVVEASVAEMALRPEVQRGRSDRLAEALTDLMASIARGAPPEEVRRQWSAGWADGVAEARARFHRPDAPVPPPFSIPDVVAGVRAASSSFGPVDERAGEIHVAMACDQNLREQLPVAMGATQAATERPLTYWLLTRGFDAGDTAELASLFPHARVRTLPCDEVTYPRARLLGHITASTMDRLLLPELVPDVNRLVYLDVDALVLGDVAELADLDLRGRSLAARVTDDLPQTRLFSSVHRRSNDLPPELADELRRRIHGRYESDVFGFNAGVLVMDVEAMRRSGFCQTYLGWPSRYGLHDQELLIYAFSDDRVPLPREWNMWPAHELVHDARVLHWLGPFKPWKPLRIPEQQRWVDAEGSMIAQSEPIEGSST